MLEFVVHWPLHYKLKMDRSQQVRWNHTHGCNCAQAVALAFADVMKVDEATIYRLSEGYGRGYAVGNICGAVSGAIMVISAISSDGQIEAANTRKATYQLVVAYLNEFEQLYKSYECKQLLALRAQKQHSIQTCTDVCVEAASLLEKYIEQVNS